MSLKYCPAVCLFVVVVLLVAGMCPAAEPTKQSDLEFFEKKIRPVLVAHCYECHSAQAKIVQAKLYLDTRAGTRRGGDSGPAIIPHEPKKSLLVEALRHESFEMPPKGKLPAGVIADFERWIEMGAPDPRDGEAPALKVIDLEAGRKFWSFQPPQLLSPPPVKDESWSRGDIDRYVLAGLEAKGLKPAPDADRPKLIRRLTFDLIGLPPTPEEIEEFVQDREPQAVQRVVDRLLASPQFGVRWGRHWLDVARYAESSGLERNVPYRLAWRYRDYVYDAFNSDLPYDQFIREQLAGDLLPSASADQRDRQLIATGFLAVGTRALTERVEEQFLLDVADEQLDTTCRAFLASTVACARCHDHKFDPVPTTDYYALAGIFRSTESLAGVRPLRREFSYSSAALLGDEAQRGSSSRAIQQRIAELQTAIDRGNSDLRAANKAKDRARSEAIKSRLADTARQMIAALAEAESNDENGTPRFAMAVRDREQPADCAVRIRGDIGELGAVAPRGFLSVISDRRSPTVAPESSGRLELAQWIASRDNPLTARVLVNRLWQHLFGQGLVLSPDNFGLTGEQPSHPELLDFLAVRFVDDGWSIKRAIRQMVLSRTYQLSGKRDEGAYALDPGNRLLWRFARRRLEAEAIRDALLAVSGELDPQRPSGSASLALTNLELGSSARNLAADDSPRYRAAYLPILRGNLPEMLGLFDMADPSLVIGRRDITSVAPQSLYLMNSKFVMEQSRRFAERVLRQETRSEGRVDAAYRLALARLPTEDERRQMLEFVRREQTEGQQSELDAWSGVCQALFGSAEFLYVQ